MEAAKPWFTKTAFEPLCIFSMTLLTVLVVDVEHYHIPGFILFSIISTILSQRIQFYLQFSFKNQSNFHLLIQNTVILLPIIIFESFGSKQYTSLKYSLMIHFVTGLLISYLTNYIYFAQNSFIVLQQCIMLEKYNENQQSVTITQKDSNLITNNNDDMIVTAPVLTSLTNLNKKREDYLSWDEYFLFAALLSSLRSKDPNTQVGACIVNKDKKIVGIGYNGFPWHCSDDKLPWQRTDEINNDINNTKYPYVCHAEMNAILNKNEAYLKNCTIYTVLFPCNECAKLIIQSRISKIIYFSDKYADTSNVIASKKMLDMARVKYIQFKPKRNSVLLQFPKV